MISQFIVIAANSHRADLHREAERSRQPGGRAAVSKDALPLLRSRRLGRVFRLVPSPERHSA
jgi:hypothetical protein